ncbi:tetratricopeptide repeat protein [Psychroserpens sp. Hel_I_66]|uniref:tetratricopeptide repeat protein n=1 Tax=Psychroserpens sp. Hel_I_66 TaxID=1250004 RepID=UPI0006466EA3|nr:tetratricopeptide repeat protein [Psychroserpens sp. Hel_I_66]
MKTKFTLIMAALLLVTNFGFAQQDEECMLNLTLMNDYVKSKKFDEAYEPWMKVRNKCPKFNIAIYKYGEKILDHKIENSTGADKTAFINDYMLLLDGAGEHFSSKYSKGEIEEQKALLMYESQKELGLTDMQIYDAFDNVFKNYRDDFESTKGLYVYFTKTVDLFKAGEFELQKVFNTYDDVNDRLDELNASYAKDLNKLLEKEEAGTALTKTEGKYKPYYQAKLEANDKISGSLDAYIGDLANCENLIPLYKKDFENNRNDGEWLKRAVSKMYNKECTDDPLYVELVKAYDQTDPSAESKYFVYTVLRDQGNNSEADKYLKESYNLQTDPIKKARMAKRTANDLKKRGSYSSARNYYREALKLNPSDGTPHLYIASMYAQSANDCGTDSFNKRAVFWYAAQEARRAGQVDPGLASNASKAAASYEGNAPTKSEIFSQNMAGKTINIGCWIGGSVKVPNL